MSPSEAAFSSFEIVCSSCFKTKQMVKGFIDALPRSTSSSQQEADKDVSAPLSLESARKSSKLCKAVFRYALLEHFTLTHSHLYDSFIGSSLKLFLQTGCPSHKSSFHEHDTSDDDSGLQVADHNVHNNDNVDHDRVNSEPWLNVASQPQAQYNSINVAHSLRPKRGSEHYFSAVQQIGKTGKEYIKSVEDFVLSVVNCHLGLCDTEVDTLFGTMDRNSQIRATYNSTIAEGGVAHTSYYDQATTSAAMSLWYTCGYITSTQFDELKEDPCTGNSKIILAKLFDAVHQFLAFVFSQRSLKVSGNGHDLAVMKYLSMCYFKPYHNAGIITQPCTGCFLFCFYLIHSYPFHSVSCT